MSKKVLLNLAQRRQEEETLVVTDQYGNDHELRLSLEGFSQLMAQQTAYQEVLSTLSAGSPAAESQQRMLEVLQNLVTALMPNFPIEGLEFGELFALFTTIQDVSGDLFASARKSSEGKNL